MGVDGVVGYFLVSPGEVEVAVREKSPHSQGFFFCLSQTSRQRKPLSLNYRSHTSLDHILVVYSSLHVRRLR